MNCIFCKIFNGQIPSKKVYESDKILAFHDINPKAPIHILVIHKDHTPSVSETDSAHSYIFADIFDAVRIIADKLSLNEMGYRLIINNGKAAGQEVFHVHVHIIGGVESLGGMVEV
jgi:histidine triad (HIT) family protein